MTDQDKNQQGGNQQRQEGEKLGGDAQKKRRDQQGVYQDTGEIGEEENTSEGQENR